MNYNIILKMSGVIAIEDRKDSLTAKNCSIIELDVVEHLEKELNPEYMNTVFTWSQIKKALEKHYNL